MGVWEPRIFIGWRVQLRQLWLYKLKKLEADRLMFAIPKIELIADFLCIVGEKNVQKRHKCDYGKKILVSLKLVKRRDRRSRRAGTP